MTTQAQKDASKRYYTKNKDRIIKRSLSYLNRRKSINLPAELYNLIKYRADLVGLSVPKFIELLVKRKL